MNEQLERTTAGESVRVVKPRAEQILKKRDKVWQAMGIIALARHADYDEVTAEDMEGAMEAAEDLLTNVAEWLENLADDERERETAEASASAESPPRKGKPSLRRPTSSSHNGKE